MKDTYIVFELVLVGFQVLIWVLLLVLSVFGYHWIDIDFVKDWATQLSFAALGVAYMLGVIFDKAIASLPFSWIIGGGALTKMRDLPSPLEMRMQILAKKAEVYEVLEKRINQHRLVRATVVNLALISISALIFFLVRLGFNLRVLIIFLFLSVLFVGLALFTGRRSAYTLTLELFHAREALQGSDLPAKKRAD
jgi:hypothetical protein